MGNKRSFGSSEIEEIKDPRTFINMLTKLVELKVHDYINMDSPKFSDQYNWIHVDSLPIIERAMLALKNELAKKNNYTDR